MLSPAVSQLNQKPPKLAQCVQCQDELQVVRVRPGRTEGRVETDFQCLYFCTKSTCTKFGTVTALYGLDPNAAPEPKIADL